MSSIDEDRQVRQQLESLFKQGLTENTKPTRESRRESAARRSNILMTACAVSGLASLVLADGAFGAYLYNQFARPNQSTPAASALAASFPMVPVKEHHLKNTTPVSGLSASRSVITGVVDPDSLTASYYWTFTLQNRSASAKEAQMQMVLPAGAVVSRVTLWIDGKPQEAAFNSNDTVGSAYNWITRLHRDPLLVTQLAPDRISIKASPVVPGKEMKVRLGITVPMSVAENGRAQLSLPFVDDANLDINCPQNIHLTCDSEMMSEGADLDSSPTTNGFLLRGNTVMGNLREISVSTKRASDLGRFATRATHSKPTAYIVGSLATDHLTSTNKLALTISATKPDCPIIGDEHTAYRLSYLWAKNEIENTLKSGNQGEAYDLSTIYRVVSPISGAVVLERKSDYEAWNLDRNLYKSFSLSDLRRPRPNKAMWAPDLYANKSELVRRAAPTRNPSPSSSPSPSASPMPNKKSSQPTVVGDQTAEAEGKFELSPATTGGIAGGITPSVAMATPTNTIELAPASKPSALKPRFELVGPVGIWAMLLLAVNFAAAISTYLMIMRFKKLK